MLEAPPARQAAAAQLAALKQQRRLSGTPPGQGSAPTLFEGQPLSMPPVGSAAQDGDALQALGNEFRCRLG
jgi:hypothetical protein